MNSIPITVVDNFFTNPDDIRTWGLSQKFTSDKDGFYPGSRTKNLEEIFPPLHHFINRKITSLFFEKNHHTEIKSDTSFQLIENTPGKGWVHQDSNLYTYIIYLSKEDTNVDCGTSFYNLNQHHLHPYHSKDDIDILNLRFEHHKSKKISKEDLEKKENYESQKYTKTINVKDKYNRLIIFPASYFHRANNLSPQNFSRLTLIGFVENIDKSNLPIIRSQQFPMF